MADDSIAPGNDSAAPGGPTLRRVAVVVLVLTGAAALVHFSPLEGLLREHGLGRVRSAFASMGYWSHPAAIAFVAVLMSCGVPRLLLCGIAGAVLGFWGGLLVGEVGAVFGSYFLFLFTRWGGRDWALHRWPRLRRLADIIQAQGVMGVILMRQVPVHGTLVNLCMGLSHLKHRHFLVGTAIGLLPEAVPATLIGAGLVVSSPQRMIGYFGLAAAAFAVLWIVGIYGLRAMRRNRSAAALVAEMESLNGAEAQ